MNKQPHLHLHDHILTPAHRQGVNSSGQTPIAPSSPTGVNLLSFGCCTIPHLQKRCDLLSPQTPPMMPATRLSGAKEMGFGFRTAHSTLFFFFLTLCTFSIKTAHQSWNRKQHRQLHFTGEWDSQAYFSDWLSVKLPWWLWLWLWLALSIWIDSFRIFECHSELPALPPCVSQMNSLSFL